MDNVSKGDLRISGSGSAAGGEFNAVAISGHGTINGDIDCEEFKISGSCTVKGNIKAKTGKVSGSASISGSIESDSFKVSGSTNIGGSVDSAKFNINGSADVDGEVNCEEIEVGGSIKIGGDCNSESFLATGQFKIDGFLNAGKIVAQLYGPSRVREIGCEVITVNKWKGFSFRNIFSSILLAVDVFDGLTVELLEGDEINLANTRAKIVRGHNVVIGRNCEIDLVEYRGEITVAEGAKVREQKKIE